MKCLDCFFGVFCCFGLVLELDLRYGTLAFFFMFFFSSIDVILSALKFG